MSRSREPATDLKSILGRYRLPSFRAAVLQTLRTLRDPMSTADRIAAHIEMDPGIQVQVLRAVNSAAFGLSSEIASVRKAVALLGRARIEPLVLSVAVSDVLRTAPTRDFDAKRFWEQSAVRAVAAREFAQRLHPRTADQAFAAGLLLDLGVPVLVSAKGQAYSRVYASAGQRPVSEFTDHERSALGYDHALAGRLIADEWQLPEYLGRAIANHHGAPDDELDAGLLVAATIRGEDPEVDEECVVEMASTFGVSSDDSVKMLGASIEHGARFAALMG